VRQVCVDVGGTFTDCLVLDEHGDLRGFKAPTTPGNPTEGFFDAVAKAADHWGLTPEAFLADVGLIVHGTTLATNVLLTRRGAKTGLITSAGFRDVIQMRRGIRKVDGGMFEQFIPPYEPLVPRHLRLGVPERILYTGEVHEPLDEEAVADAASRLRDEGCTSIALAFLHAYANPEHELRAKEIVAGVAPGVFLTASHEVMPTWREFERFSTTVVSAYVGPAVEGYLRRLAAELGERDFAGTLLIMLSNGLVQTVDRCADRGASLLTSGPAAAPAGALSLARAHGAENLIEVDMGGTSFDVCVVRHGVVPRTTEAWVGEERVGIKMVDVATIGAGGGSIAWVDQLGLLRVGPDSAGADPGPAAYGRGDQPTVTDADLVLGYIDPAYFLGGDVTLDVDRARNALAAVGEPLDMDAVGTALAVFETVTATMADEVTETCTKQGHDVRDFMLVAGGGAGGIHAAAIAERLGISDVLVPRHSALLSAYGMFTMDLGQEVARSRFWDREDVEPGDIAELYASMQQEADESFAAMGIATERVRHVRSAEMRYRGQFHELEVELPDGDVDDRALDELRERFHEAYERRYGYAMRWQPVEFFTFHLKSAAPREPALYVRAAAAPERSGAAPGVRSCVFAGGPMDVPVHRSDLLGPGERLDGPALIDDATTTVLVPPGFSCEVDAHRNFLLRAQAAGVREAGTRVAAVNR
jgi:N-methylhydantoinase A